MKVESEKLRVKNLHNRLWKNLFNIDFDLKGNKAIREYVNKFISKAILGKYYLNCFIKELISLFTYSPIHFKKAFTLAEVLITLGIIGVIAAMTMPVLINNYKKTHYVIAFKKTYNTLQQAVALSQVANGPLDTWDYSADETEPANVKIFAERYIIPYLKIVKNCGIEKEKGCLPEKVMLMDGREWPYGGNDSGDGYKVILAGGIPITIGYVRNCTENKTLCFSVTAHIDGLKKQGIMGKDYFAFDAYPGLNQIYPRGIYNNSTNEYSYQATVNGNWNRRTTEELETGCCASCNHTDWCGGRIVLDGYKMNY